MTLNDFLHKRHISMVEFARMVGTTPATISRVADGQVVPRKALLKRIHEATDRMVTPNDLIGIYCAVLCEHELKRRDVPK